MKALLRLLVLVAVVGAAIGAYRMWKGGCCGEWGGSDPWSTWTCGDEQAQDETQTEAETV